jgi:hypothetical protein
MSIQWMDLLPFDFRVCSNPLPTPTPSHQPPNQQTHHNNQPQVWLWYVSVTLLSFMLGFLLLRFLAFLLVWVGGFEFWFLPNLFDESLSFVDSFKPVRPSSLLMSMSLSLVFLSIYMCVCLCVYALVWPLSSPCVLCPIHHINT